MQETYLSDAEYDTYFETLGGMRSRVAAELPINEGMQILDIATGYGYFAAETARRHSGTKVVAIDITSSNIDNSLRNIQRQCLSTRVRFLQMDAAHMAFGNRSFDLAVNFLGFEDIHMTRGRQGIEDVFLEVGRVLKPKKHFCLVVMPPDQMETKAQRTEVALYSYICDSTWLPMSQYEAMLGRAGIRIVRTEVFLTGKKLTPEQARTEIRFAVENVPKLFGRPARTYEAVWAKFGRAIEKNGLGQCSKTVLIVARKV
jgi:ubiquinone/menaquinone biosynthesis C-methylase UbiE